MQIYIAYKYTNVKNKSELKINLEHFANLFENKGHKTFLLNRDAKAWGKKHVSTVKNLITIITNVAKSNTIFAYINSNVVSKGVLFEFFLAKLLNKRVISAIESSTEKSNKFLMKLSTEVILFNGIKDLEAKLDKIL